MRSFWLFAILLFTQRDPTLTIQVEWLHASEGQIMVAVYDAAQSFMDEKRMFRSLIVPVDSGPVASVSLGLPPGTYAVSLFHDVNADRQLNTNFAGIPKEPYGFSNNPKSTFGPPDYTEAVFRLINDTTITVKLP